jgi:hypothetical protein
MQTAPKVSRGTDRTEVRFVVMLFAGTGESCELI